MSRSDFGDPPSDPRTGVLFVCLGNICRSPLAEGVLQDLLEERGLADRIRVDSAGTGAYHVGEPPDVRSRRVARDHGIELEGRARQVEPEDFQRFHHVLAMDRANLRNLERLRDQAKGEAALDLLRSYDPEAGDGAEVPDPYYGGPDGFEQVYRMIHRSCSGLLDRLTRASAAPKPPGSG